MTCQHVPELAGMRWNRIDQHLIRYYQNILQTTRVLLGTYIKHFPLHVNSRSDRKRAILNKILRYFRDTYFAWNIEQYVSPHLSGIATPFFFLLGIVPPLRYPHLSATRAPEVNITVRRSYRHTFATMAENRTMELSGWRVRGQISQQSTDGQQARGLFPQLVGSQKAQTNPETQGSGAQPAASS